MSDGEIGHFKGLVGKQISLFTDAGQFKGMLVRAEDGFLFLNPAWFSPSGFSDHGATKRFDGIDPVSVAVSHVSAYQVVKP